MKEKNNSLLNILEKDKVWTKLKKFAHFGVILLVFFVLLLLVTVVLQYITLKKMNDYIAMNN